jgi:hypothetical protein
MDRDVYEGIGLKKLIKQKIRPQMWDDEKRRLAPLRATVLRAGVVNVKDILRHIKATPQLLQDAIMNATSQAIAESDVILATNTGIRAKLAYSALLEWTKEHGRFVIVMDEAEQAIAPSCLGPLSLGNKLVMAGDPNQLAPTIKSDEARPELGFTFFSRMAKAFGCVSCSLSVQYRMTKIIQDWSSHRMYQDNLRAHPSVAYRTLSDEKARQLKGARNARLRDLLSYNMVLIDTSCYPPSEDKRHGTSLVNDK